MYVHIYWKTQFSVYRVADHRTYRWVDNYFKTSHSSVSGNSSTEEKANTIIKKYYSSSSAPNDTTYWMSSFMAASIKTLTFKYIQCHVWNLLRYNTVKWDTMLLFIFIFLALVFFNLFIIDFSRFRMLHFSQPVPVYKNEEINLFSFSSLFFRRILRWFQRCHKT